MKQEIKRIKFAQNKRPGIQFDLVMLEDLFARTDLSHRPTDLHKVDFFILLFIKDGSGLHTIDFKEYKLKRGTVLTIREDQIHKFHQSHGEGFMLLFTHDFIVSYLEKLEALKTLQLFNELLGSPKIQLNEEELADIFTLVADLHQEYFEVADEYSSGILRSLLHILISKLYRVKSKQRKIIFHKKYLEDFIHFQLLVEESCFQTKKVNDYAEKMGVTTKTLNNIVQSIMHKPAKAFIDQIVITQIKRLLINSSYSIKEIAYAAGFDEPTNLFKYFKKHTHHTPETFRKTHK